MVRSRYTFEKRQRELAKQRKKKDKAQRRAEAKRLRQDEPAGEEGAFDTEETSKTDT